MEDNLNGKQAEEVQERMYSQSEVDAIISQYKLQLGQLKRNAQEEINRRDLANFYQTLSVLFEIVRNRDAYSSDFVKKTVDAIENGVNTIFDEEKKENEQ